MVISKKIFKNWGSYKCYSTFDYLLNLHFFILLLWRSFLSKRNYIFHINSMKNLLEKLFCFNFPFRFTCYSNLKKSVENKILLNWLSKLLYKKNLSYIEKNLMKQLLETKKCKLRQIFSTLHSTCTIEISA